MDEDLGRTDRVPSSPRSLGDVVLRPMRQEDVPAAERLSAHAFAARDGATSTGRTPEHAAVWAERTRRTVRDDGPGCWVVERGGELLGFATSLRRETLWALATYAVDPACQGRGVGRLLLEAALGHSRGCLRGMVSSSADPRAARRYRLAGFDLHPQMTLTGTVDRTALPELRHVRDGTSGDQEWMDSLDRLARGAAHGPDHGFLRSAHPLRVIDRPASRGYAYLLPDGSVALLAASDRRTASRLLWDAFAHARGPVRQTHVTGANQWAVEVGMAAGLSLGTEGYLGVRGLAPPSPYLHHGALL